MKALEVSGHKIRIAPFVYTTLIWGVVATLVVLGFTPEPYRAAFWFALLYGMVVCNLFFLVKSIAVVIVLLSYQGAEKQTRHAIQLAFWGTAKFSTLGALIAVIWKAKDIPTLALAMGMGTLLVVPFIGGFWWSNVENQESKDRELQHA